MTNCPSCFTPITTNLRAFICVSGKCAPEKDLHVSALVGKEVTLAPVEVIAAPTDPQKARNWKPPESHTHESRCKGPMAPACPSCHFTLPRHFFQSRVVTVAVAGARHTGKTVYIGVAYSRLRALVEQMGSAIAIDPSCSEVFSKIYARAFDIAVRSLPDPTPELGSRDGIILPLIFSLGNIKGVNTILAVRDVAGEDLERGLQAPLFDYLGRADLVIFLWDPMADPTIRAALAGIIPPQGEVAEANVGQVLQTLLTRIGDGNPRVAVAMSKFDLIHELSRAESHGHHHVVINKGAGYLRNSVVGPKVSEDDLLLVHEEVRSLLMFMRAQEVVNAVTNPARGTAYNYRFFAVSALGTPPENFGHAATGLSPFRCLDPLKWVLGDLGVLEKA